jgi:hypothetical protein
MIKIAHANNNLYTVFLFSSTAMHVREAGKKEDLFKELTNFEIKISLFDEPEFDVEPKWDVAERFKDILYKEYPDLFKGKKPGKLGKKADLMGIILQESLQNEECSLGTRARYLGWKKTSRGERGGNRSRSERHRPSSRAEDLCFPP